MKELKGSEVEWQDFTNKDNVQELEQRGRAIPQSFDINEERKYDYKQEETKYAPVEETKYAPADETKYAPAEDGKSSP